MKIIHKFDDSTIEKLFGAEDAENERPDRFKEYFFYNNVFDNLTNELPLRLLVGHKGIGKSALLRRAYLADKEKGKLAILLQPSDILGARSDAPIQDFNLLIERWKDGLLAAIAAKTIEDLTSEKLETHDFLGVGNRVKQFVPLLAKMLVDRIQNVSARANKAIVHTFSKEQTINIYIDDIDRGWTASESDIRNISALLNAMRDIAGSDQRIRFRIGLRSDVYFLVRTADESTDKIERNVVWLRWNNHEILCVIAKRILTYFGESADQAAILRLRQSDISDRILSRVVHGRFQGRGHWSNAPIHVVLLSLTRQRPRDLIKLMHGAAKVAFVSGGNVITSAHLEQSFANYSAERLQDIINEFRTELPNVERLLLGLKPQRKGRKTTENYLFSTDHLVVRLRSVMQNTPLQYRNKRPVTPRSLVQFLYKIDFITARKDLDGFIDRKYFDQNRFLASEVAEFGYDWEIHPAYRWALQPQDVNKILDEIDL